MDHQFLLYQYVQPITTTLISISYHKALLYIYNILLPFKTFQFIPSFNTLRTGDADLRFYITTVQDG